MLTTAQIQKAKIKKLKAQVQELIDENKRLRDAKQIDLRNSCWICGKTKITKHHIKPQKEWKNNPFWIPLCDDCHENIELWKRAIAIMKKEKGLSITKFREIINSLS